MTLTKRVQFELRKVVLKNYRLELIMLQLAQRFLQARMEKIEPIWFNTEKKQVKLRNASLPRPEFR